QHRGRSQTSPRRAGAVIDHINRKISIDPYRVWAGSPKKRPKTIVITLACFHPYLGQGPGSSGCESLISLVCPTDVADAVRRIVLRRLIGSGKTRERLRNSSRNRNSRRTGERRDRAATDSQRYYCDSALRCVRRASISIAAISGVVFINLEQKYLGCINEQVSYVIRLPMTGAGAAIISCRSGPRSTGRR